MMYDQLLVLAGGNAATLTHADIVIVPVTCSSPVFPTLTLLEVPLNDAPPPISPLTAPALLIVPLFAFPVESLALSVVPLGRCHTPTKLLSQTPVGFC